jgi:ribonuclease HI
MKKLTTFTDGGARGNPGPAGIGIVILEGDKQVEAFGKYIGETTNNQAEYQALIVALRRASELGAEEVECKLDSELVVKQMRREYRVKEPGLQALFMAAWNSCAAFKKVSFSHVRREQNSAADAQVNEAIDQHIRNHE